VGEIGIPRREFLYELTYWEAARIVKGYRRRGRLTHQLLAEVVFAAIYSTREPKGTTVADMFEPYPKPQSMANREGLRDLLLYNAESGAGVRIQTEGDVAFSLLHDNDTQLKNAAHTWELEKDGKVYAHFDAQQLGIGNGSCGQGTGTLSEYQIPSSGTRSYRLLFTPVNTKDTGIGSTVADCMEFSIEDGMLLCSGNIVAGTGISVYNMGGVRMASTTAGQACSSISLPVSTLHHGSYIVVVSSNGTRRVYKVAI
jgi:beta-galactosidase